MAQSYEYKTEKQVNYGWGLSLDMTGKAPAIAKRIFSSKTDAESYVSNADDSAIPGLILSVFNDSNTDNNGAYFVTKDMGLQKIEGGGGGSTDSYTLVYTTSSITEGGSSVTIPVLVLYENGSAVSVVDARAFVKDGMVSSAYVSNANLVITFNTDAGKQNITVPIADIFNVNNYYTKQECNSLFMPSTGVSGTLTFADGSTLSSSTDDFSYIVSSGISLQSVLDAKANDNEVVHLSGDEVISGIKKFNDQVGFYGDGEFVGGEYNFSGGSVLLEDSTLVGGGEATSDFAWLQDYDGTTLRSVLNDKAEESALTSHTSDSTIHVTSNDKNNWDKKISLSGTGSSNVTGTIRFGTNGAISSSTNSFTFIKNRDTDLQTALDGKVNTSNITPKLSPIQKRLVECNEIWEYATSPTDLFNESGGTNSTVTIGGKDYQYKSGEIINLKQGQALYAYSHEGGTYAAIGEVNDQGTPISILTERILNECYTTYLASADTKCTYLVYGSLGDYNPTAITYGVYDTVESLTSNTKDEIDSVSKKVDLYGVIETGEGNRNGSGKVLFADTDNDINVRILTESPINLKFGEEFSFINGINPIIYVYGERVPQNTSETAYTATITSGGSSYTVDAAYYGMPEKFVMIEPNMENKLDATTFEEYYLNSEFKDKHTYNGYYIGCESGETLTNVKVRFYSNAFASSEEIQMSSGSAVVREGMEFSTISSTEWPNNDTTTYHFLTAMRDWVNKYSVMANQVINVSISQTIYNLPSVVGLMLLALDSNGENVTRVLKISNSNSISYSFDEDTKIMVTILSKGANYQTELVNLVDNQNATIKISLYDTLQSLARKVYNS